MTRTGEREIGAVSGGLPDNPGELASYRIETLQNLYSPLQLKNLVEEAPVFYF